MKLSRNKLIKRLLIASLMATSLTWQSGAVYAEDASGNTKTVTKDNYEGGDIYAGYSDNGDKSNNKLTVSDVEVSGGQQRVGGGEGSNGNADNNHVEVRNVTGISYLHGGYPYSGNGSASHNTVNVWNSSIYHIHGGHTVYGFANYNTVNFYSGKVSDLTGAGYANYGTANWNTLNVFDGTLNGLTQGGYVDSNGTANYNTVNVHGGTINGQVTGGYVGSGSANYNEVNLYGGKIVGDIYGGWAPSGEAIGNEINIYGNDASGLDLTQANLYAGKGSTVSGNRLNFYNSGITMNLLHGEGFQSVNFFLPDNYQKDTVLTLTGSNVANLGDLSTVGFGFSPNSNIRRGDVLNLIHNTSNTISINDNINVTNNYHTKMSRGVSFDYDLDLVMSSDGHTLTGIVGSHGGLKEEDVKQIPISNPVPVFMISDNPVINSLHDIGGLDFEEDGDRAEKPEDVRETHGFEIFAHSGYGHLKTKTGKNTFVRTDTGNYDLGFARSLEMKNGTFVFAPIIEHSAGHYDAVLSDGRKGYGSAKYAAGGFIFRKINDNGFYFEGSARLGRSENNFISDHFKDAQSNLVRATYHTSAPIFAGHIRLGKAMRLNKNNLLDIYGIYAYARQGGMNTELSTGDPYKFSSVSSSRVRVGYRLTTKTSRISRIYTGLAFQYESNSDSEAKTWDAEGMSWNLNAGSKGASGMLELGWQIKPKKDNPWLVDINATAWVGHQKGATAMAKIQKSF